MWPRVRATLGSRSGPITTSATTAMTAISLNAMSNTLELQRRLRYSVFSFFTSPSIVCPAIFCEASGAVPAGDAGSAPSGLFMPSLKPFTAPPRSCPMLRSFLVPQMRTTTSNTISQCQMLSPPMIDLLWSLRRLSVPGQHSAQRLRSTQDVHVQMHHVLLADTPGIDYRPVTIARALLSRQSPGHRQHPAQHAGILARRIAQRRDMLFRDDHEMHRHLRAEVVESEDLVVLVHFLRRDLAPRDLAENTVVHGVGNRQVFAMRQGFAPGVRRAAFSSSPDMPSRWFNSASTSCGPIPNLTSRTRQWNQRSASSDAIRILSPSLAAMTASVASSPIFLMIASSPFANRVAT